MKNVKKKLVRHGVMVIASRAKEAVPGNAEWDFFYVKGG